MKEPGVSAASVLLSFLAQLSIAWYPFLGRPFLICEVPRRVQLHKGEGRNECRISRLNPEEF